MPNRIATGTTNTAQNSIVTGSVERVGKPWSVSSNLLNFLGIWENGKMDGTNFAGQKVINGFILKVYNDSKNLPTVGCGHLVVAEDNLFLGNEISEEQAKEFLRKDLENAEKAINKKIKVPLYQYEYDSLVSIAFNAGSGGVSQLCEKVNEGDYESIPDEIEEYRTGGGNGKRRKSEAKLFKTGIYDATH